MTAIMAKPWWVKISALLLMKQYAERALVEPFSKKGAPIFIDNRGLDGFLDGMMSRDCDAIQCDDCNYCRKFSERFVFVEPRYREEVLALAARLDEGLVSGKHWI
jgi:hypothetical protein